MLSKYVDLIEVNWKILKYAQFLEQLADVSSRSFIQLTSHDFAAWPIVAACCVAVAPEWN
jgi:hypothetical protein